MKILQNIFNNILHSGIKHQTTIPCNPQQNDVTKMMDGTFLSMVRSTMFFKNVKLMFWGEGVLYVAYIKNICPSFVINKKSSYEV